MYGAWGWDWFTGEPTAGIPRPAAPGFGELTFDGPTGRHSDRSGRSDWRQASIGLWARLCLRATVALRACHAGHRLPGDRHVLPGFKIGERPRFIRSRAVSDSGDEPIVVYLAK